MWIRLPEGTTQFSVEQQNFAVEAVDSEGWGYCRIPNHFAGRMLAVRGFEAREPPEGTALDDLPLADPLRDGTIAELSQKNTLLASEFSQLRMDLGAINAKLASTLAERDDLKLKLHEAEVALVNLRDQYEDEGKESVKGKK
jgi:hypothetical protein